MVAEHLCRLAAFTVEVSHLSYHLPFSDAAFTILQYGYKQAKNIIILHMYVIPHRLSKFAYVHVHLFYSEV